MVVTLAAAATADRLTLPDVLSDLERLGNDNALIQKGSDCIAENQAVIGVPPIDSDLTFLESLESPGPTSLSDYVRLSSKLRAGFAEARRLNTESVSSEQVGLLLPSERGNLWDRSVLNAPKATRTDLLHTKVAMLQTQADDWDRVLRSTLDRAGSTKAQPAQSQPGRGRETDQDQPDEVNIKNSTRQDMEASQSNIVPVEPETVEFEDDDPWNDLS